MKHTRRWSVKTDRILFLASCLLLIAVLFFQTRKLDEIHASVDERARNISTHSFSRQDGSQEPSRPRPLRYQDGLVSHEHAKVQCKTGYVHMNATIEEVYMRCRFNSKCGAVLTTPTGVHLVCFGKLDMSSLRTLPEWTVAVKHGCAQPPPSIPWHELSHDPDQRRAAVFTPYHMSVGGGEKYLLSFASVLQAAGYVIDVLLRHDNSCRSKEELLSVAAKLRVDLDPANLNVVHVDTENGKIKSPHPGEYSVFVLLGNEKLPQYQGIAFVNVYVCQFPFDLSRQPASIELQNYISYDRVVVYSTFAMKWYSKYIDPVLSTKVEDPNWHVFPQLEILAPPVTPFQSLMPANTRRRHIVMIGRFFFARQHKGYPSAIKLFIRARKHFPAGTKLRLVGNIQPGHEEYVNKLVSKAHGAAGNSVEFIFGASNDKLRDVLSESLVQWHMTGIDSNNDPASLEHFGISICEGMTAGVIPVVMDLGGVHDIIGNGTTGFISPNLDVMGNITSNLFKQPQHAIESMRTRANASILAKFTYKQFGARVTMLVHKAKLEKPFMHLLRRTSNTVKARQFILPQNSRYAALIMESRQHYALEYVIKNVAAYLQISKVPWQMFLMHGSANAEFATRAARDLAGLQMLPVQADAFTIPQLNLMMTSVEFWKQFADKGVDHIFIFQSDSLMLRGGIDSFLQYDYVGAPWALDNVKWGMLKKDMPNGVGNGGLSLRSIRSQIDACVLGTQNQTVPTNEDFFIVRELEQSAKYRLPTRTDAYKFAIEVPCDDLHPNFLQNAGLESIPHFPVAVHAPWFYFGGPRYRDLLALLESSVCPSFLAPVRYA